MKKMFFEDMRQMKRMIDVFEKNDIEYSWYFLNRKYEIHLGDTNIDHVKLILREHGIDIPFTWGDYSW